MIQYLYAKGTPGISPCKMYENVTRQTNAANEAYQICEVTSQNMIQYIMTNRGWRSLIAYTNIYMSSFTPESIYYSICIVSSNLSDTSRMHSLGNSAAKCRPFHHKSSLFYVNPTHRCGTKIMVTNGTNRICGAIKYVYVSIYSCKSRIVVILWKA